MPFENPENSKHTLGGTERTPRDILFWVLKTALPIAAAAVINGIQQHRTAAGAVGIGVRIDLSTKQNKTSSMQLILGFI